MSKPRAVIISDLHFSINTLKIALQALQAAFREAEDLDVDLIIAGDLNDTKAIIRGEVMNALIDLFKRYQHIRSYTIIGNHDLINEKGKEHSLGFLAPYTKLVDGLAHLSDDLYALSYQSTTEQVVEYLNIIPDNATIIMHQGVKGAYMGEYIVDKSSIDPKLLSNFRVISGHYHRYQAIGTVTYVGTSYTTSFAEANDGDKGLIILNEDGSFTRKILHLPKHIILQYNVESLLINATQRLDLSANSNIWVKITGPKSSLKSLTKQQVSDKIIGHMNFRLDLIPDENESTLSIDDNKTEGQILDDLIDMLPETGLQIITLKNTWRDLLCNTSL